MTNTMVTMLAKHLRLNADSGACPDKTPDDLDKQPNFQHLATITEPHIKRLYALFVSAREQGQHIASLPPDPNANTPVRLRPHGLMIMSLLQLFERAVRLRFNLPDDCNIVIDGKWRIFSFSQPQGCRGDCDNCAERDDCPEDQRNEHDCQEGHDCGPDCKKVGGPGCGRPECTCEEPADGVERTDITVDIPPEIFTELKAVGVCLASMLPINEPKDGDDVTTQMCINREMYVAMVKAAAFLDMLASACEEERGWTFDPEEN